MISGRHWYVAQTQPHREALAAAQLAKQGFDVFLPRCAKVVRHARRTETRIVGYFPGYIFVSLDPEADPWRSINGTYGIRGLIMFGDRPARAPDALIEHLREITDDSGLIDVSLALNPGDRVRLVTGPFADLVGTLERLEGGARVRVLMDLIGGAAPVVTDGANVALAS